MPFSCCPLCLLHLTYNLEDARTVGNVSDSGDSTSFRTGSWVCQAEVPENWDVDSPYPQDVLLPADVQDFV